MGKLPMAMVQTTFQGAKEAFTQRLLERGLTLLSMSLDQLLASAHSRLSKRSCTPALPGNVWWMSARFAFLFLFFGWGEVCVFLGGQQDSDTPEKVMLDCMLIVRPAAACLLIRDLARVGGAGGGRTWTTQRSRCLTGCWMHARQQPPGLDRLCSCGRCRRGQNMDDSEKQVPDGVLDACSAAASRSGQAVLMWAARAAAGHGRLREDDAELRAERALSSSLQVWVGCAHVGGAGGGRTWTTRRR